MYLISKFQFRNALFYLSQALQSLLLFTFPFLSPSDRLRWSSKMNKTRTRIPGKTRSHTYSLKKQLTLKKKLTTWPTEKSYSAYFMITLHPRLVISRVTWISYICWVYVPVQKTEHEFLQRKSLFTFQHVTGVNVSWCWAQPCSHASFWPVSKH